ncbi:Vitellogenin-6 [Frankliniella fusca]|uniref:Vitellogenin-6 n=1 Tax=Frankliniella fusca TaxID=407009 RepID=A0AAE1LFP8_9NEOP|nr:Vitellogenin-6 [Frankliniella fusca]
MRNHSLIKKEPLSSIPSNLDTGLLHDFLAKYSNPMCTEFLRNLLRLMQSTQQQSHEEAKVKFLIFLPVPPEAIPVPLTSYYSNVKIPLAVKEQLKVDYFNKATALARETMSPLFGMDAFKTILTPLMSPFKTPPRTSSQTSLRRSNAFCLSPASATDFTARVLSRIEQKKAATLMETDYNESAGLSETAQAANTSESVDQNVNFSDMDARLNRIEKCQQAVSSKLDLLLMNVGRLYRRQFPAEKSISAPYNMPPLPLKDNKALGKFEKFHKETDRNLSRVCDYMSTFIKNSVVDPERKIVHALLAHLLSNDLAKDMNLEGHNNKIGFRSLYLYKIFQVTIKTGFSESNLTVAEDALQKWLKDAK